MRARWILLLSFGVLLNNAAMAQEKEFNDSMMHYFNKNNFSKAIFWGEKNVEYLKTKLAEDTTYTAACNNLAFLYVQTGDFIKAKQLFISSLNVLNKWYGPSGPQYLFVLRNLAQVNVKLGLFKEAEDGFASAFKNYKTANLQNTLDYACMLVDYGVLKRSLTQNKEAEKAYYEAMALYKKLIGEDSQEYRNTLANIAIINYYNGNLGQAEKLMIEVIAANKKAFGDSTMDYANMLNTLGAIQITMGNTAAAIKNLELALPVFEKTITKKSTGYGSVVGNIAVAYFQLTDYVNAEKNFKEQLEIFQQKGLEKSLDYATALNNLGNTYKAAQNPVAEDFFKKALLIKKEKLGTDHFEYIQLQCNLALFYANRGRYNEADSTFNQALANRQQIFDDQNPDYLLFLTNRSEVYRMMGEQAKSVQLALQVLPYEEKYLINKLDFLSEKELIAYLKLHEIQFSNPFSCLQQLSNNELCKAAYNNLLLIKSISLQNISDLTRQLEQSADTILSKVYKSYKINQGLLNKVLAQTIPNRKINTDSLAAITNLQEKELLRQSAGYRNRKEQLAIDWRAVKRQLQPTEAAIEFVRFKATDAQRNYQYYYAALLLRPTDTSPIFVKLSSEKDLTVSLANFPYTAAIPANKLANLSATSSSQNIYNLLWKPLLPYLKQSTTIYFSPDGLLHQIAFAAIPAPNSLLCSNYNLIQLTSTRLLVNRGQEIQSPGSFVLFGGINYNQQSNDSTAPAQPDPYSYVYQQNRGFPIDSFNYLPTTLAEINSIKKQLSAKKITSTAYIDSKATEAAYRNLGGKSSPQVLHIATHGFSLFDTATKKADAPFKNSDNPLLRNGLVMAGGNKGWQGKAASTEDDGILTALEITNVPLPNTQLAVLSACQTGTGELKGSEGIFGLQRAFKIAGANYIMASLWPVPDKETSEFMNAFYANWLAGNNIRQAFNTTQKAMRKKYAPYYWAAFTLVQ